MKQTAKRWMTVGAVVALAAITTTVVICQIAKPGRVREPAVAGLFYPKDAATLSRTLDALLAGAPSQTIEGELRGLVCPHAGYPFSGPIAATGYRLLPGREFQTVVLLAISHHVPFQGASVTDADIYRTPLGDVKISPKAKELAKIKPFLLEPHGPVQRPDWASQASHPEPPPGEDTPETWEHSGEVQVPFLQKTLRNFALLPVVLGMADPAELARVLAERIDDQTLVVASSDLSHYHAYEEAQNLDRRCVDAICKLDIEQMQSQEACGKLPILTLMHLARAKGWKTKLLDYRNSGDTAGDKRGVVGYTAIAFYAPRPQVYSIEERKTLLALARRTLAEVVTHDKLPDALPGGLPPLLTESKGCFVTLTKGGVLRGCIGNILPQGPLAQAIMENARNSATRDGRFPRVQPDELDKLEIEISVLTTPQPLPFTSTGELLKRLKPHVDGVVLQIGNKGATYLPQVWAQIPDREDFLNSLAQKAGCAPADWRKPGVTVSIYHVEHFKESEL